MLPLFTTQIFHYYYYYYYFCTEPRLPLQERVKSVFHAKEFGKIINFKTPEIAKVSLQFGLKLIFPFSRDTQLVKIISSNFGHYLFSVGSHQIGGCKREFTQVLTLKIEKC